MRGISQLVADTLIGDESAMRATLPSDPRDLFYLYVLVGAGYGCWKIAEHPEKDEYEDAEPVCSEQLWDFYQAIANCLLETPMPADEGQTS